MTGTTVPPVLELRSVRKVYGSGETAVRALGVDLVVERGDYVAVMGASGSGKSTLMNVLGCLDIASSGTYLLDGIDVAKLSERALAIVRNRKIGFVFQAFNLLPRMSARANVELPMAYAGVGRAERRMRADAALEMVGLSDRGHHEPNELSGGQQQRVAIARSLVTAPTLILADEPTGNLDSSSTADVLGVFDQLNNLGRTIVMITHEPDVAAHAGRLVVMRDGLVVEDSTRRAMSGSVVSMSAAEVIRSAVRGLSANKLRSGLTVLGILIGVAAVILLVAVGNGSAKAVADRLSALGSNTVTIAATGGRGPQGTQTRSQQLTLDIAHSMKDDVFAPDVLSVSPVQTVSKAVTAGSESVTVTIVGTTPSWFAASNTPIGKGAAFTADDDEARNRVVVLGTTTADNLFGDQDPIGQSVTIAGAPYTVVGVLKQKDSTGLQDSNDTIIAPLNRVRDSLAGYGTLTSIVVQAKTADTVNAVQAEVTAILDHALGLTSSSRATYRVLNQAQLLETQTQTADTFTVLLGAVAAISLLVGGIGVTNIMLVTVTERTREIGIRKALGPQRPAILGQFLAEATLLSLVGGLLGVIVGVVGSSFRIAGTDPVVVPGSIVLAFAVSAFIGLFFGSYPANRAARLLPIEALRYQ